MGQGEWQHQREEYRRFLFDETLAIQPVLGDIAVAPLTVLAFDSRGYSYSPSEKFAAMEIDTAVHNILGEHNSYAENGDREALFCIPDPNDLSYVAELTAKAITRWDHICLRKKRPSPFADLIVDKPSPEDFERTDTRLVVETAAAAIEILQAGYDTGSRDVQSGTFKHQVSILASRGPLFATGWIQGKILANHCDAEGLDTEQFLQAIPSEKRKAALYASIKNPLATALLYAENLVLLDEDNLMKELGWSREEVSLLFTHHMRETIRRQRDIQGKVKAVAHAFSELLATPNLAASLGRSSEDIDRYLTLANRRELALKANPVKRAAAMIKNIETVLSPANLANKLGLSEEDVQDIFTPGYTKVLARSPNPMNRVYKVADALRTTLSTRNIARTLGWTVAQVETNFSFAWRGRIALEYSDPLARIKESANTYRLLVQAHDDLPAPILRCIAGRYDPNRAHRVARLVSEHGSQLPPRTSREAWLWTIAGNPNGNKKSWQQSIAAYVQFLEVATPSNSLSQSRFGGKTAAAIEHSSTQNETTNPWESLFALEPGPYLQELAAKAGVLYADLKHLLACFRGDETNWETGMETTLQKFKDYVSHSNLP